jgi:hypothetical protein
MEGEITDKTESGRSGLAGGEDKAGGVYADTNLIGHFTSCWDGMALHTTVFPFALF